MKVITICGSMRYASEMQKIARALEAKNRFCVIQCVYNNDNVHETEAQIQNIIDAHWKKIDISDMIYVVNINGYIGISTQNEITYALSKGKEVIYHEPLK